ncbi:hypothetical protein E2C01_017694 [Portunus trituberculatus]|uniref:Uncharacterized protein n=1 Tax=Portunus trituberculatus TaxID=210409 RepID=A0A5B7DUI4_PORTR|nr:hypothetical protein [Portunus trituberculatus]
MRGCGVRCSTRFQITKSVPYVCNALPVRFSGTKVIGLCTQVFKYVPRPQLRRPTVHTHMAVIDLAHCTPT